MSFFCRRALLRSSTQRRGLSLNAKYIPAAAEQTVVVRPPASDAVKQAVAPRSKCQIFQSAQSGTKNNSAQLMRHGKGDGVVTLNVGGKEFVTLRSTVYMNSVLRDHVVRAEANQEFTHGGKAVFIDRSPEHFALILQHLRNQASGIEGQGGIVEKAKAKMNWTHNMPLIQLPANRAQRQDLFVEARHYQIEELKHMICMSDMYIQIAANVGGSSGNPFATMSNAIRNVRNGVLALGTFGFAAGSQNDDVQDFFSNIKNSLIGNEPEAAAG